MASPLREFSKSGQKLPAIGLGTMSMAAVYGPASTQERVNEVLNRTLEKGCLFWDTASVYSAPGTLGDNERQIGSFLRSHPGSREKVFISSKFSIRYGDGTWTLDGSREWCHLACEGSLEALGIDQIDMYYAHRPSDNVEIEETMGALKELKDSGKIKFTVEQLERAEKIVHIGESVSIIAAAPSFLLTYAALLDLVLLVTDAFQIEISPWTPEVI